MDETNSMMELNRSATMVMPTGASQPPICTVWMPWVSATMISTAAITVSAARVPKAMKRCRFTPRNSMISPAANAGRMIGMTVRYGMAGSTQSAKAMKLFRIVASLDFLHRVLERLGAERVAGRAGFTGLRVVGFVAVRGG